MNHNTIVSKTAAYVKEVLSGESTGHDWWHTSRVHHTAVHIASRIGGVDMLVVELGALLHDIADYKFNDGDETVGPSVARQWLESLGVAQTVTDHVSDIILTMSFKGAQACSQMKTREGMIVQDADWLDSIGAIGIARTLAYGGYRGNQIYNPEESPKSYASDDEYKSNRSSSINHFHEKLFLLRDLMNTEIARSIADRRHRYMESFLHEFLLEWEGRDIQ